VNWGGPVQTLATDTTVTFQPVVIPQAVTSNNAPPSIGECDVVGLDATIDISSVATAGNYQVALAVYVSNYNPKTAQWDVLDGSLGSDAAEDDMLHVTAHSFNIALTAAETTPVSIQLRGMLPFPIRLGAGQALHVTLTNADASVGTINFVPFIRAKISHIN
jgi:hypothetical protein